MKKWLGTFLGLVGMVLLTWALVLAMRGFAPSGQAPPAQQPIVVVQAVPTPTPCVPLFLTPAGPPVEYKAPPNAPQLPPELLTPQPILPPECAGQLRQGPTATPTPLGWKPQPAPFELTPGPPVTPDPKGPIYARGFEDSKWDPRKLEAVNGAEVIAIGTVLERLPARWATADGLRPPNVFPGSPDFDPPTHPEQMIFTPVVLRVDEYLKGLQPQSTLVLRVVGGQVGEDIFLVSSAEQAALQPGRVVLYLTKNFKPAEPNLWRPAVAGELLPDGKVNNPFYPFPLAELRQAIAGATSGTR